MTDIRFYDMKFPQDTVLPALITKIIANGHRVVLKMKNEEEVAHMDEHLWTFSADSFLPHGSVKNGNPAHQPIWLTHGEDNPNGADVLVLAQGAQGGNESTFAICCIMIDGHDPRNKEAAREKWRAFKAASLSVSYWQQTESGGWENKA